MICGTCSNETEGIKLNGKLYCSHCGNILPEEPKTSSVPEISHESMHKYQSNTPLEDKPDLAASEEAEKLEKVEESLDSLMDQYFRPAKLEITTPEEKPLTNARPAKLDKLESEISALENQIVKANRPRINRAPHLPPATVPKAITPEPEDAKTEVPQVVDEKSATPDNDQRVIIQKETPTSEVEEKIETTLPAETPAEPANALEPNPEPEEVAIPINVVTNPETIGTTIEQEAAKADAETAQAMGTEKVSVNLLQAEKGFCVKCRELRDMASVEEVTMKNGHPALRGKCNTCGTTIFKIKKGIVPGVQPHKKSKNKGSVLASFFKATATQASPRKPESKKKHHLFGSKGHIDKPERNKEKSEPIQETPTKATITHKSPEKRNHKPHPVLKSIIITLIIIALLVGGFVGFVYYVTNYAASGDKSKIAAESKVSFDYRKPGYTPPGYSITYKTNSGADYIEYDYEYQPDPSKQFAIKISKTDITLDSFQDRVIRPLGKQYMVSEIKKTQVWVVEEAGAFFLSDGKLYEIRVDGDISKEELIKISDSIL